MPRIALPGLKCLVETELSIGHVPHFGFDWNVSGWDLFVSVVGYLVSAGIHLWLGLNPGRSIRLAPKISVRYRPDYQDSKYVHGFRYTPLFSVEITSS